MSYPAPDGSSMSSHASVLHLPPPCWKEVFDWIEEWTVGWKVLNQKLCVGNKPFLDQSCTMEADIVPCYNMSVPLYGSTHCNIVMLTRNIYNASVTNDVSSPSPGLLRSWHQTHQWKTRSGMEWNLISIHFQYSLTTKCSYSNQSIWCSPVHWEKILNCM